MKTPKCHPGAGLRAPHFPYLENRPQTKLNWFEAISENYMDSLGRPREMLRLIRNDYDLALHGVSMGLASGSGLRASYLKSLRSLVDDIEPVRISDHLCWTGVPKSNLHDLLPFPYTSENLAIVIRNIDQAQTVLGRQILVENVSTYMTFEDSHILEWDFLVEACRKSGAGILLDINNIYVSAKNHGFDPKSYIEAIPPELVGQIHLAGYTDMGTFLFDTHSKPVYDPVWDLFSSYIKKHPAVPFMVEWDEDIPEFERLEEEVIKGVSLWQGHHSKRAMKS